MDNEETLPDSPLVEEQSESEESESHLVKRGKEYGLTPEQSEVLSLYLQIKMISRNLNPNGAPNE